MTYPKMDRYLTFNRKKDNVVKVKNEVFEISWEMDMSTARFLRALDGHTNPYKINSYMSRKDVDHLLEILEKEGLLDDGKKITTLGIGSMLIPLWTPKVTQLFRLIGSVWNKVLMMLWLPVFTVGMKILLTGDWDGPESIFGVLYGYMIFVFGIVLHELSHVAACLDYRGRFFELGIMTHYYLPGAYVLITYDNVRQRMRRVQISAAGVESNMLLAGICLCFLKFGSFDPIALLIGALLNVITAVFNCSLIEGLDGMLIYQELLGEDFLNKAKRLIWDSNGKAELRRRGINGKITITACYLIVFMQLLLPVVLAINVLSILESFI